MNHGDTRNGGHRYARRKGFTLLEVAIVLGIIGVIVSAVFVAAAVAEYRTQLNKGSEELNLIVGNVRALYQSQNTSALPNKAFAIATPILLGQGVFPAEMVSGGLANNPWDATAAGGSVQIQIQAPQSTNPSTFDVRFINIPAEPCTDLLVRNSLPGRDTGLLQINAGPFSFFSSSNQLPITPIRAAAACAAGGTYTIDWIYTFAG